LSKNKTPYASEPIPSRFSLAGLANSAHLAFLNRTNFVSASFGFEHMDIVYVLVASRVEWWEIPCFTIYRK